MTDAEAELESFRQQWREEVSARGKPKASLGGEYNPARRRADGVPPTLRRGSAGASRKYDVGDKEQGPQSKSSQPIGVEKEIKAAHSQEDSSTARREPLSALEHYEKAVEREGQGSLGDSVDLYRKAFRVRPHDVSGEPAVTDLHVYSWIQVSTRRIRTSTFLQVRLKQLNSIPPVLR